MNKYDYPGCKAQEQQHQCFKDKLHEFRSMVETSDPSLKQEILNFLKTWLVNHIIKVDSHYGPFLNRKGIH